MSGFTDEFYRAATERLGATAIAAAKPYYATGESPSFWFEPTEVWEIRGADLQLSPVHRAAAGRVGPSGRGVGLRFPRFLRIRDDRTPTDASGPELIAQLFGSQAVRAPAASSVAPAAAPAGGEEEEEGEGEGEGEESGGEEGGQPAGRRRRLSDV